MSFASFLTSPHANAGLRGQDQLPDNDVGVDTDLHHGPKNDLYKEEIEDGDDGDDDTDIGPAQADDNPSVDSHAETGPSNSNKATGFVPAPKRRRVTRACDECRRKKIKCDGKQPCTHCTVYSYECTYDQPSNRRRNPATFYIHELETRLQQADSIIRAILPGVDISKKDLNIDRFLTELKNNATADVFNEFASASEKAVQNSIIKTEKSSNASKNQALAASTLASKFPTSHKIDAHNSPGQDTSIESMVVSLGRLDVDETGHLDYVGHSSGRSFLQHVRAHFLNDNPDTIPPDFPISAQPLYGSLADSPSETYYFQQDAEFKIILPSKEIAFKLIEIVWSQACVVLSFGHKPSFMRRLDELYATDPDDYTPAQVNLLPLVYCFLAVGVLFSCDFRDGGSVAMDVNEGYKYFVAARKMIDIIEARDIDTIQTIILMILFLQSTARLATCYSYIGVALRAALRLGLHRKVSYHFNPIETEVRKRIFWTILKMDVHISAMLGLPRCIDENDIDQDLPLEIDDEYITEDAILPHPGGVITTSTVANLHTRLLSIVTRIVEEVYPIKENRSDVDESSSIPVGSGPFDHGSHNRVNCVSYAKVLQLENELQAWLDSLPFELRPGVDPPKRWMPSNRLLNLSYCYVKIALYRPFIHYVGQKYKSTMTDERPYACAANCISTARIVVHLADDLYRRDMLRGAHLFSVYTIFFSTAVLIYYVHEDPENPHMQEFRRDAELGKALIFNLRTKSAAAERTSGMLSGLFELLNKRLAVVVDTKKQYAADDFKRKRNPDKASGSTSSSSSNLQRSQSLNFGGGGSLKNRSRVQKSAAGKETLFSPLARSSTVPTSIDSSSSSPSSPASTTHSSGERFNVSDSNPATSATNFNLPGAEPGSSPHSGNVTPGSMPTAFDFSQLNSVNISNVDTNLYFPALGSNNNQASSLDQQQNLQGYAGSGQQGMQHDNLATSVTDFESQQQEFSDDYIDNMANMFTYSAGPMDQLEAEVFGRFLPPYMYQQQASQATEAGSQRQSSLSSSSQSRFENTLNQVNLLNTGDFSNLNSNNVINPVSVVTEPGELFMSDDVVPSATNESGISERDNTSWLLSSSTSSSSSSAAAAKSFNNNNNANTNNTTTNNNNNNNNNDNTNNNVNASSVFLGAIPTDWDEFLSQHNDLFGLKNVSLNEGS
ncbi:fungal-specific transcription factor domain-containing protein [Lipomyces japonicus]|uniref:fungal-specific transcription factor domain-containing protein n=1 Tax=Lipomyces japonicus TaxID=56871 RepID=UPI0034CD7B6B